MNILNGKDIKSYREQYEKYLAKVRLLGDDIEASIDMSPYFYGYSLRKYSSSASVIKLPSIFSTVTLDAFANCPNLKELFIGNNLYRVSSVDLRLNRILKVSLPGNCKIDIWAYNQMVELELRGKVKLDTYSFQGLSELRFINSQNILRMGEYAIQKCNIDTIYIGSGVCTEKSIIDSTINELHIIPQYKYERNIINKTDINKLHIYVEKGKHRDAAIRQVLSQINKCKVDSITCHRIDEFIK